MTKKPEFTHTDATEKIIGFVEDIYATLKELDKRITALESDASDEETK